MWITGFNRNRDSYQIPLALAEVGKLQGFVTDYYYLRNIKINHLQHRQVEGLPASLCVNTWSAVLLQAAWQASTALGANWNLPEWQVDQLISRKIQSVARNSDTDLILYSSYASAFSTKWARTRRKILFQFHPFPDYVRNRMLEDSSCSSTRFEPVEEVSSYARQIERHRKEIERADLILCASSVTRRSLVEQGYPEERVVVVPYGVRTPPAEDDGWRLGDSGESRSQPVRYLFVGSGIQRKGLHHLLDAWRRFVEDVDAELTIVARTTDRAIVNVLPPRCTYVGGLSEVALRDAYSAAHVFCLPSVVEGFGLVLLEALSQGCHLVTTHETGAPDLGLTSEALSLIDAPLGSQSVLRALRNSYEVLVREGESAISQACAKQASAWSWERFRSSIRSAIGE